MIQQSEPATTKYIGTELELFAAATVWKSYLRKKLQPFLGPSVLEVGAGLGATTRVLCSGRTRQWVCLEPDSEFGDSLRQAVDRGDLPACCEVVRGTIESLGTSETFDTVLYIDVLEHIEDDRAELERAARRLAPGGHLVVLAPAHQWLFTPFDRAIGHYRRYTRRTLQRLSPSGLTFIRPVYLDAVGLLASLGNRFLLRRSEPSRGQIAVWDKLMVPASRLVDPLFGYRIGKSVLGVWRAPSETLARTSAS